MCEIDTGERCEVWEETLVKKSRKRHRCDCCHGPIEVGQSYIRHFDVFEGEPTNDKMCLPCNESRDAFEAEHRIKFNPSSMRDMFIECINEETSYDDDDNEVISETGKKWSVMIEAMKERSKHWQETSS